VGTLVLSKNCQKHLFIILSAGWQLRDKKMNTSCTGVLSLKSKSETGVMKGLNHAPRKTYSSRYSEKFWNLKRGHDIDPTALRISILGEESKGFWGKGAGTHCTVSEQWHTLHSE
jgi:hypothetical protein